MMLVFSHEPVDLVYVAVMSAIGVRLGWSLRKQRWSDPWREAALTERARGAGARRRARRQRRWSWLMRSTH